MSDDRRKKKPESPQTPQKLKGFSIPSYLPYQPEEFNIGRFSMTDFTQEDFFGVNSPMRGVFSPSNLRSVPPHIDINGTFSYENFGPSSTLTFDDSHAKNEANRIMKEFEEEFLKHQQKLSQQNSAQVVQQTQPTTTQRVNRYSQQKRNSSTFKTPKRLDFSKEKSMIDITPKITPAEVKKKQIGRKTMRKSAIKMRIVDKSIENNDFDYFGDEIVTKKVHNTRRRTKKMKKILPEVSLSNEVLDDEPKKVSHNTHSKLKREKKIKKIQKRKKPKEKKIKEHSEKKKSKKKKTNNTDGSKQQICCLVGCSNPVAQRREESLKYQYDLKQDFLENGWTKICAPHYFSDLYSYKKFKGRNYEYDAES